MSLAIIAVRFAFLLIQRYLDDVCHALRMQIILKDVRKQIGLPAASDTGDNFDSAVAHFGNETLQVPIPLDYHRAILLRI